MSRKKKTPPFIVELIGRHMAHVEWIEEKMDVKQRVPVESQADHVKEQSIDYMVGQINGMIACLEDALHAYGCYAGYRYVARPNPFSADGVPLREIVGLADPRFKEYRRQYLVRG